MITFLTDFGLEDDFVGTCHGVMKVLNQFGEVSGGRREKVSAVEGGRHRIEPVPRVLDLDRMFDAAELLGRDEQ